MPPSFTDDLPQFPGRAVGNRGQDGIFGTHNLNIIGSGLITYQARGSTGLPTGFQSGGIPNMSATLIAAGQYQIRFPPIQALEINPVVYGPSGAQWKAQVFRGLNGLNSTPTGAAIVQVFTPSNVIGNLPSGSTISLQLQGAPITAF